jgi:Ca-activated chloride channel family protein
VTIFGRYRGSAASAAVELEGTTFGDPLRMRVARDVEAGHRAQAPWLAASWARARIRDLEDRYAAGERGSLEHEIVGLSKRCSVLSRFTAFLAIDHSQVVNPGGRLQQVVQAVESPAGWGGVLAAAAPPMPPPRPAPGRAPAPMASYAPLRPTEAAPMPAQPMSPPMLSSRPLNAAQGHPTPGYAAPQQPGYAQPPGSAPPAAGAPMGGHGGGGMPPAPHPFDGAQRERQSPPTPPPASAARREGAKKEEADRAAPAKSAAAQPAGAAYLIALATLARELDAQGRGRADAAAIRLLRQRLTEWIEDVRSVGGQDAIADVVEHLVQRLSAALALGQNLAGETIAVAAELAKYAAGSPPPAAPKKGRAFWK